MQPSDQSTLVFSIVLPSNAVPRVVALVDDLRDQGYVVSATLTRDTSMRICPLCDQIVGCVDDLHEHGT